MKTILLHPSYFPSIEQMAAVAQAESVVFEVEDNYQKQTYRNRTFIAHSNGKLLLNAYRTSPFFEYYEDDLEDFFTKPVEGLMAHNLKIFEVLCELLGIDVEVSKTTSFEKKSVITDLRILIDAKRKSAFQPEPYTQVHEANHPFLPNLSVLDLLFNEGPNALSYLERQQLVYG